ncbi:ankyrin repeat-containing domain protein [Aspergillus coremiiformis]|uniref:Ankyrin repeat domain-containing protein 54 n=1 Tax=Aspergillus coremiiformis TaxID=138285 RepID=A0A5N6Z4D0_9EURO|nr:ankyrin repeat-containing domain protein [Aspergillus coremiiformis]
MLRHGRSKYSRGGGIVLSPKACQHLVVEYLLNKKLIDASVNSRSLFEAASMGHHSIGRTLLRYGANVQAVDDKRQTPLHLAAEAGRQSVVKTLLNSNANPNALNRERETPLHRATRGDKTETMVLLLDGKADVNASSRDRKTPLHLAVYSAPAVRLLMGKEPNVDATDINGQTPLHIAAGRCKDCHEAAVILLKARADISIEDKKGATPLSLVVKTQDLPLVKDYYETAPDKHHWKSAVYAAIRIAIEESSLDIVKFLLEVPSEALA